MHRIVAAVLLLVVGCAATPAVPDAPQLELIGPVHRGSVIPLIQALEAAVEAKQPFVYLTIDSPGGEVYAGLGLIYAMRIAERAGTRTVCTADGYAASMAAVIFESCSVRIMSKRTALLFHGVSTSQCGGNATDLRRCTNEIADLTKLLLIISRQRLNIPLEELIRRSDDRDYWLGYEEALEIGATDFVVD